MLREIKTNIACFLPNVESRPKMIMMVVVMALSGRISGKGRE
jgi:hypothetical protein